MILRFVLEYLSHLAQDEPSQPSVRGYSLPTMQSFQGPHKWSNLAALAVGIWTVLGQASLKILSLLPGLCVFSSPPALMSAGSLSPWHLSCPPGILKHFPSSVTVASEFTPAQLHSSSAFCPRPEEPLLHIFCLSFEFLKPGLILHHGQEKWVEIVFFFFFPSF